MLITRDAKLIKPIREGSFYCQVEVEMLPQVLGRGLINYFYEVSTRSCLARLGYDFGRVVGGKWGVKEGKGRLELGLIFYGEHPIKLKAGDKVCRFYFRGQEKVLPREELEEKIKKGELALGEKGKDFEIAEDWGLLRLNPTKVIYEINPEKLPQDLEGLVRKEDYLERKEVEEVVLNPRQFLVTETNKVKIPKDSWVYLTTISEGDEYYQINSRLVDPGFEDNIRLELVNLSDRQIINPPVYGYLLR